MAISLKILNVGKIQGHQRIPRGKIRLVSPSLGCENQFLWQSQKLMKFHLYRNGSNFNSPKTFLKLNFMSPDLFQSILKLKLHLVWYISTFFSAWFCLKIDFSKKKVMEKLPMQNTLKMAI